MQEKIEKNFFCVWDNWVWIGIVKFSILRAGYFPLEAKVLISSPEISDVHKRDFFEQKYFSGDQWIWSRCCDADFNSAWPRLPYSF